MADLTQYQPPAPEDLVRFKAESGLTGNQIASLIGLSNGRQWRKYTGGSERRDISAPMLFTLAAQLELEPEQIERVLARMRAIGAQFGEQSLPLRDPA